MANALLIGLSKAYANVNSEIPIHIQSFTISSINVSLSSSVWGYTGTRINFKASMDFLYWYVPNYENITENTAYSNTHIVHPPTFVILTSTETRSYVIDYASSTYRGTWNTQLKYTKTYLYPYYYANDDTTSCRTPLDVTFIVGRFG